MQEKPVVLSQPETAITPLWEIALLFLRLGVTAFGGPAAHIAMMRVEVVRRRKWLSEQRFLDLLGATNLIPGPNSTEMAIHIGHLRGGLPGLITAGACFILPAGLIVAAIAWGYIRYGNLPEVNWLFYGIQPVIVAIIFQALWNLGKQAVKGPLTGLAGAAVFLLYWLNINELMLLFGAGLAVMILENISRMRGAGTLHLILPALPVLRTDSSGRNELCLTASFTSLSSAAISAIPYSLPLLFFTFLKIGSVLYGSGYVLLAFLRADFV